jgi:hypothetical protein
LIGPEALESAGKLFNEQKVMTTLRPWIPTYHQEKGCKNTNSVSKSNTALAFLAAGDAGGGVGRKNLSKSLNGMDQVFLSSFL